VAEPVSDTPFSSIRAVQPGEWQFGGRILRVPCLHRFGGKHAARFTGFWIAARLFWIAARLFRDILPRSGKSSNRLTSRPRSQTRLPKPDSPRKHHRRPPRYLPVARRIHTRARCPLRPPLFRSPSNNGAFHPRRATPKTPISPQREKIALKFPTFRFSKTWDLRIRRAPNHPGITPSIPAQKRAQNPRFPAWTPPTPFFRTCFQPSENRRNPFPHAPAIRLRSARNNPP
jgi:hypothetical protein